MADESRMMTPETLGAGIANPLEFRRFSAEQGFVVAMYKDQDVSVVVWNLEPGQENSTHVHGASAHVMLVLEGNGQRISDNADPVPLRAGECLIVPRGSVHGIRNTGDTRMSYLAITTLAEGDYVRAPIGEQRVNLDPADGGRGRGD
jgi:mannose-6-phosphate isomerase-like protein (cupin superfamily)